MAQILNPQIAFGTVHHGRGAQGPKNAFRYPTFFYFIDTKDWESRQARLGFWGKLYRVDHQDHLQGDGQNLQESIFRFLETTLSYRAARVRLLTYPRAWGTVFKPVSFWFCESREGLVDGVLCEVNNTFGERHLYWIHEPEGIRSDQVYRAQKQFHVSPFFQREGHYRFSFDLGAETLKVKINYHQDQGDLLLSTGFQCRLEELGPAQLRRTFWLYGWSSALIVLRIHWQAVKLWWKKATYVPKPKPLGNLTRQLDGEEKRI